MDQITYLNNLAKHLSGYYREEVLILPTPAKSNRYQRLCLMGCGKCEGKPMYEMLIDCKPHLQTEWQRQQSMIYPINTDYNVGVRKFIQVEILRAFEDKLKGLKDNAVVPSVIKHIQDNLGWRTFIKIHRPKPSQLWGWWEPQTEVTIYSKNNRQLYSDHFRPSGKHCGLVCDPPFGFYYKATDFIQREEFARSRIRAAENKRLYEEQKLKNQSPSSPSI